MKTVAVGIDIGGTNTSVGIVDMSGNVLVRDNIKTPDHGDINLYLTILAETINNLINTIVLMNPDTEIKGIGIGAPNANFYKGTIEHAPNLSFKGIVPFVALFKEKFHNIDNIILTNDANAAALGEMIYGGAKGMKNFVMITLGTGVGSGIVVDGKLLYGHDGFAGECGHTTLVPGGRLCGCGSKGHLETYCSATGMKRTAFEILVRDNTVNSILAQKSYLELNSKMIYDAALEGDSVALEVFELTGKWLGESLADTVHHTSPEAIFLFGGPTAAGELLFKPTRESMEEHLLPLFKNKIKLLPSQLKPGDAAIVGASALVY